MQATGRPHSLVDTEFDSLMLLVYHLCTVRPSEQVMVDPYFDPTSLASLDSRSLTILGMASSTLAS